MQAADATKKGLPIAWQHINLHGRYEFLKQLDLINVAAIIRELTKIPMNHEAPLAAERQTIPFCGDRQKKPACRQRLPARRLHFEKRLECLREEPYPPRMPLKVLMLDGAAFPHRFGRATASHQLPFQFIISDA